MSTTVVTCSHIVICEDVNIESDCNMSFKLEILDNIFVVRLYRKNIVDIVHLIFQNLQL